jgi:nicotinamidase-related amidase
MTRSELKKLPPSTIYGYGRESLVSGQGQPRGPGYPKGNVTLPDGQVIDAGDMYIQGTWNAELYDPLMELYKQSKDKATKPDVILRTHWMAMGKELEAFLEAEGLTTLLFAGLNIQQAVWAVSTACPVVEVGTMLTILYAIYSRQTICEARGKGYDTILLDDCCAAPGDTEGKARSVILDNCKTFGGLILTSDEFVAAAGKSQA